MPAGLGRPEMEPQRHPDGDVGSGEGVSAGCTPLRVFGLAPYINPQAATRCGTEVHMAIRMQRGKRGHLLPWVACEYGP